MSSNNQSNQIIKWGVVILDFLILNAVMYAFRLWHPWMADWTIKNFQIFFLANNIALMISQTRFRTVVHERLVTATDILRRVILLTMTHVVLAYMLLKFMDYEMSVGWLLLQLDTVIVILLIITRFIERKGVKRMRQSGRNIRLVTFVGSDPELQNIYMKLMREMARGYKVQGYYADAELRAMPNGEVLEHLGSMTDLNS